ncbi:6291_t:CDS:2, partial [Cetraspora pellucida]
MPELMEKIIENLNNEIYSLYSCSLVSRHWCEMSIPILWQDPFSYNKNAKFISSYLSTLNKDEKLILKGRGIDINLPNPIFYYARFLRILSLTLLDSKVMQWIDNIQHINQKKNGIALKEQIINLLFEQFIKSGATLHGLYLCGNVNLTKDAGVKLTIEKSIISTLESQKKALKEILIIHYTDYYVFTALNNFEKLDTIQVGSRSTIDALHMIKTLKA